MITKKQNMFQVFKNQIRATVDMFVLWIMAKGFAVIIAIVLSFPKRERMSHNNGIAGIGTVRIVDNPEFPAHDFFEPGKVFPARIRHAMATFLDDAMNGIRSFSIKFSDDYIKSPFDLEMNSGDINLFWSCSSFLKFVASRNQSWGVQYVDYYRKYPEGLAGAVNALRRNPNSYQNIRYHCLTPFLFIGKDGIKRYAKYRVIPFNDEVESGIITEPSEWDIANQRILPNEIRGRTYLAKEYQERVNREGARYRLQIQTRIAKVDDDPNIFNNMLTWDNAIFPYHDLAIIDITKTLSWEDSLKTTFSINNMPRSLGVLPAKSIYDFNSLNYMRSNSEVARKARLLSYKVWGYPPPIPDNDNRNTQDWGV